MAKTEEWHAGRRERLRMRFHSEGLDGFADHEVLELLLHYAIPRRDTNDIAHQLIKRYDSFSAILEADAKDLATTDGVGDYAATFLTLVAPVTRRYLYDRTVRRQDKLTSPEKVAEYFKGLLEGRTEEVFYVLCLDSQCRVIIPARVSQGTLDRAVVEIRDVVWEALRHKAHSVILAHNHPAGRAEPSAADRDLTRMIVKGLATVGIPVRDHVIRSIDDWFSFAQGGILDS